MQKILITAGGTEEPIDGVRTISNFSTGKTGAVLADIFTNAGFDVTLITSERGAEPSNKIEIFKYKSFNDLNNLLITILQNKEFKGVIHAAAVSDYSVDYLTYKGEKFYPDKDIKLDSSESFSITLKPNFKIIEKIKSYSKTPLKLIGFKLTKNGTKELINNKIESLFKNGSVDYVVHNDLTQINGDQHLSTIYSRGNILFHSTTKRELGQNLLNIFKEK